MLVLLFSKGDHGGAELRLWWLVPCLCPAISLVPVTLSYWRVHHTHASWGGFISTSRKGVAEGRSFQEVSKLDWLPSADGVRASALITLAERPGCLSHSAKALRELRVSVPYAHLKSGSRSGWSRPSETWRASLLLNNTTAQASQLRAFLYHMRLAEIHFRALMCMAFWRWLRC